MTLSFKNTKKSLKMFYEKIDYLIFYQIEDVKELQVIPFNINAQENRIKEIKMHWQMFIEDIKIRQMKDKSNNVAYYFTSMVKLSDMNLARIVVDSIISELHCYRGIIILRHMTSGVTEIHVFVYPVHITTDTIKPLPSVVHVSVPDTVSLLS